MGDVKMEFKLRKIIKSISHHHHHVSSTNISSTEAALAYHFW